jgi:hypothetical protein
MSLVPRFFNIIFALSFLYSFVLQAQTKEGEIENQQVVIEKNKKIELPEATRDFEKINIQKKTVEPSKQDYPFTDYQLPLPLIDAKIKILTIKEEPLPKLYANYVKAGFGNYTTTYLEAFLYNKRSDKFMYGLNAKHFASAKGPVRNSASSDNHALLYGTYFLKNAIINSELGYYRTARYFYGYDQNLELPKDTMKQIFHQVAWNIGLKNTDTLAKLSYKVNFELAYMGDKFHAQETEGLLNYQTKMKLNDVSSSGAKGLISVANRIDGSQFVRNLISLQPYYQRKLDKLTLTGGINFAYENDTILSKKNFHLYPAIKAEYPVVKSLLNAYLSLDGNMERHTLRTTVKENPWMTSRFGLSHANKLLDITLGGNGSLFNKIDYKLAASYLNYKNLPFYVNSPKDSLKFVLAYDSSTIQLFRFKVDLTYNIDKRLLVGAAFQYQSYNMHSLKNHWHMPTMQTNYYIVYNFKEKIITNLNSFVYSGIPALNQDGTTKKLPTIVDINLKVDYLFSKNFSAFFELNNILANKYQRYLFYSQKGINFLIGATCSF